MEVKAVTIEVGERFLGSDDTRFEWTMVIRYNNDPPVERVSRAREGTCATALGAMTHAHAAFSAMISEDILAGRLADAG